MAKTYSTPSLEPIGGPSDVVPMLTLGPVVAAVAGVAVGVGAAVAGAGAGAVIVYGVAVTPCGPYW